MPGSASPRGLQVAIDEQHAMGEACPVDVVRLVRIGIDPGGAKRALEVVEHRDQLACKARLAAALRLFGLARGAAAIVLEVRLGALRDLEVLVALLACLGEQLVEIGIDACRVLPLELLSGALLLVLGRLLVRRRRWLLPGRPGGSGRCLGRAGRPPRGVRLARLPALGHVGLSAPLGALVVDDLGVDDLLLGLLRGAVSCSRAVA